MFIQIQTSAERFCVYVGVRKLLFLWISLKAPTDPGEAATVTLSQGKLAHNLSADLLYIYSFFKIELCVKKMKLKGSQRILHQESHSVQLKAGQ